MVPEAVLGYGLAGHQVLLGQMRSLLLTKAQLSFCCPLQPPEPQLRTLQRLCWHSRLPPQKQGGISKPSPPASVTLTFPMQLFLGFCPSPAVFVLKVMRRAP